MRPLRRSSSSSSQAYIRPDSAILVPRPQLVLHNTSIASSSTTRLAIMIGESNELDLPVSDNNAVIPKISNRVTTLSTVGSVETSSASRLHDLTHELDITEVGGSSDTTWTLGHQDTDLEETT